MKLKTKPVNVVNIILCSVGAALLVLSLSLFCCRAETESITEGVADELLSGYMREETEPSLPEGAVPIEGIGFTNSSFIRLACGGTYNVEFELKPENANETTLWMNSNPRCIRLSEDGTITALSVGESMISLSPSSEKFRKNALVMVLEPPPSILNVPYIYQCIDYPNGCESCSTVMALNYLGIDITTDEFIDNYLDMCEVPHVDENGVYAGYSQWTHFAGDPRDSSGLCCYAPVIVNALNKFIDTSKYKIDEMYDVPIEDLCAKYITNGIPVVFWATMYMQAPFDMGWSWTVPDTGEIFTWVAPMHCMLLVGFDDDFYYFNDPVAGKQVAYTKEATETAYEGLFRQAVAISPIKNKVNQK